jgi:uncharacterized protein YjbI with pentapeptide repeats
MRRLAAVGAVTVTVAFAVVGGAAPASADAPCAPGSGADLAGRTVTAAQLEGATLACANLRGARLVGLDLAQADLSHADLDHATLARTDLTQARLAGADLAGATLTGENLGQATLTGADLTGAHTEGADLTQADLTGARLAGLDARGADFTQATLTGADLTNADLTGATLIQATTTGARVAGTRLAGATLEQVNDAGAVVSGPTGVVPVDAIAGIVAALLASLALRRWWRRPVPAPGVDAPPAWTPGRVVAAGAAVVALGALVLSVVGAAPWIGSSPTEGTVFAPLEALFLTGGCAVVLLSSVRRARGPVLAVAFTAVGAAGAYLLSAAAIAGASDSVLEVTAFVRTCAGPSCAGGLARGWVGGLVGLALLAAVFVLARVPGLTRPNSGIRFTHTRPSSAVSM